MYVTDLDFADNITLLTGSHIHQNSRAARFGCSCSCRSFQHGREGEDHPHERRRRQACPNTDTRQVLFVVDTSGSIGESTFNKVRDLLASISENLCDHLRVAMITYSHNINLEFCFKCHTDRRDIFSAIRRVRYRGGTLTPPMPPSVPARPCSLKDVDFHMVLILQTLTLCISLMADIMGHAKAT